MKPDLFGLALRDGNGDPDPDLVLIWGLEMEDCAVMVWFEEGQHMTAVTDNAEDAEKGLAAISTSPWSTPEKPLHHQDYRWNPDPWRAWSRPVLGTPNPSPSPARARRSSAGTSAPGHPGRPGPRGTERRRGCACPCSGPFAYVEQGSQEWSRDVGDLR